MLMPMYVYTKIIIIINKLLLLLLLTFSLCRKSQLTYFLPNQKVTMSVLKLSQTTLKCSESILSELSITNFLIPLEVSAQNPIRCNVDESQNAVHIDSFTHFSTYLSTSWLCTFVYQWQLGEGSSKILSTS